MEHIDIELINKVATKYGHVSPDVLNNAFTRYEKECKPSKNSVVVGGIEIDTVLAAELADQFYRYGYSEELAEIIGGEWGLSYVTAIITRINRVAGKTVQSKSENTLAQKGKKYLRQKFGKVLKDMRPEIESIRGVACAMLFMAQNGATHLFPTEIIEIKTSKLVTVKSPFLFKAYIPSFRDYYLFSSEADVDRINLFKKLVAHNTEHISNPDMMQGITVNANIMVDVSAVWDKECTVTPVSSIESSLKRTYSNSVTSVFRGAVYRYVRLEFGRSKDKAESSKWEKESRGWMTEYAKHEHERAVEIPFLAISDVWLNGSLTNLEKQILREVDSVRMSIANNEDYDDKGLTASYILRRLNSRPFAKPIKSSSFYDAFNSLVKKAEKVLLKRDEY